MYPFICLYKSYRALYRIEWENGIKNENKHISSDTTIIYKLYAFKYSIFALKYGVKINKITYWEISSFGDSKFTSLLSILNAFCNLFVKIA